jgi:hypothetical protein
MSRKICVATGTRAEYGLLYWFTCGYYALSPEFQSSLKNIVSPYGQGDVSIKIKNILKNIQLNNIIIKKFYDL